MYLNQCIQHIKSVVEFCYKHGVNATNKQPYLVTLQLFKST